MAQSVNYVISELSEPQPSELDRLESLIRSMEWTDAQVKGQLKAAKDILDNKEGNLFIASENGKYIGFISVQFHLWNKLSQIHCLIISNEHKRRKIATELVAAVEKLMREKLARGIYVDTPVNNQAARKFYEAMGFKEDYIMTQYYDEQTDGVTYLKLFAK